VRRRRRKKEEEEEEGTRRNGAEEEGATSLAEAAFEEARQCYRTGKKLDSNPR